MPVHCFSNLTAADAFIDLFFNSYGSEVALILFAFFLGDKKMYFIFQ